MDAATAASAVRIAVGVTLLRDEAEEAHLSFPGIEESMANPFRSVDRGPCQDRVLGTVDFHETASLQDVHDVVPIMLVVRSVGSGLHRKLPQVSLESVLRSHQDLLEHLLVSLAVHRVGFLF